MQKITPFFWFNTNAEEAVNLYVSIFKNSKIGRIAHRGDEAAEISGQPKGAVMTIDFQLEGQDFVALNGGPHYSLANTSAISFVVDCHDQEEVDYLWDKLSDGGQPLQCGWLVDKFGITWQIVPESVIKMLLDKDAAKANRAMQAMMPMKKLDIAKIQEAYEGRS